MGILRAGEKSSSSPLYPVQYTKKYHTVIISSLRGNILIRYYCDKVLNNLHAYRGGLNIIPPIRSQTSCPLGFIIRRRWETTASHKTKRANPTESRTVSFYFYFPRRASLPFFLYIRHEIQGTCQTAPTRFLLFSHKNTRLVFPGKR